MKKRILSMAIFVLVLSASVYAQTSILKQKSNTPTSLGLVIYSNDTETVWNALRLANYSKNQGDTVSIFLLAKGVEVEKLIETDKNIKEQTDIFLNNGGSILGCGTCLKSRNNDAPQICTISSLADLYSLIRRNKKVLTF
jgi:uncharacterized protein involved in oxidation of intracellular sulfur